MSRCKVAVIGAGSYVFGPSVLSQALLEHRLEGLHLALVDPDADTVEGMAGVGRRMALETGADALVTAHTEREAALDGADYVICSASVQMQRRFRIDSEIIDRHIPGHLISEFGGVAGISYSLRQIALLEAIARDMQRLCPQAWLLNVANPLPRVCQAAQEEGVQTVGFCAVSLNGYGMLARIFWKRTIHYPFTEAREQWQATMAGLNHFSWLIELKDRATGEDRMPELRHHLLAGATAGQPRAERIAQETGYLLCPGDDHTKDFLPPAGEASLTAAWHGTPEERQNQLEQLRGIADGRLPWDALLHHPAWERPLDFIAALSYDRPAFFHALNLINRGQIPQLPTGVFVETPCAVSSGGLSPQTVSLPKAVRPYCEQAARVTDTIVRAARERSRARLYEAVELDPTILDKRAGRQAIDACLNAHADLLPAYTD